MKGLQPSLDIYSKHNQAGPLTTNLCKQEDLTRHGAPLSPQIAAALIKKGDEADPISKEALIKDIVIISRLIMPQACEIFQCTATKPDINTYPSGKQVIKSISPDWIRYFTKNGQKNNVLSGHTTGYIL